MSFLSWWFGDDANAQKGAAADAKLNELNQAKYGAGYVMIEDQVGTKTGVEPWVPPAEQQKQIDQQFDIGWEEGKKNVTGTVAGSVKVISDGLGSVIVGVPLWVWFGAAVAGFAWFGGFGWLRKVVRRKLEG